ncbi:protein UL84 [macacine betaherpesvirus 9]|uniref:Protein UL84 n=1 Tax=macacine betaherpesvirus 9 TaxID=2560568 RepID=A0A192XNY4_9BETA|nr:protein UL84 [macacine betaherpesvirus 9]ANC96552.1 protein UL84 [macacine betaherpesvirus 9]
MASVNRSQLIQFAIDCNNINFDRSLSSMKLTCTLSHENPVILLVTDGTENNLENVILAGYILSNTRTIYITVNFVDFSPVCVNMFALPIVFPTSALSIDNYFYFKENMDPIIYQQFGHIDKDQNIGMVVYSMDSNILTIDALVTKICWKKSDFQPVLKTPKNETIETMYCLFTLDTDKCTYWEYVLTENTPICEIDMISENNVSVYKIEYRTPTMFIFLRYVYVTNSLSLVIPNECNLRLKFFQSIRNQVALNINMPYFSVSPELGYIEIYFPGRMTLKPYQITELNLRGTFTNLSVVGIFIPKSSSHFYSLPFIWQPCETFKVYLYCETVINVNENTVIGHVYFTNRNYFPHAFHPKTYKECKSKVSTNSNSSLQINFMGNVFTTNTLPNVVIHPIDCLVAKKKSDTELLTRNSINLVPRFKRMQL